MKKGVVVLLPLLGACVVSSPAGAFGFSPAVVQALSTPAPNGGGGGDCDGHGGIADAILNEERQEGDSIWVVSGVRCVDGTEFIYERDYLGPATPPPPEPGLISEDQDQSQPQDDPPAAAPADDSGSSCIPDDTDWMNGGCG